MTYFTIFQPITAVAFMLVGAIFTVRKRPDLLLGAALASFGFGGLWVLALGSLWMPSKILGLWSLGYVVVIGRHWTKALRGTSATLFLALAFWVLVGCFLAYALPLSAAAPSEGTQGTTFRPAVQLLGYLTALSFVPLALEASRCPGALERILSIYAATAILIAAIGIYQFIALRLGLGFMPIYRPHGFHSEAAAFSVAGQVIYRVYSLAGEPKSLGVFLLPYTIIGIMLAPFPRAVLPAWWNRRVFTALTGTVCVMTYSTALLLALALSFVIAVALVLKGPFRLLVFTLFSIMALSLLAGGFPTGSDYETRQTESLGEIIYTRTVDRLAEESAERFEAYALDLLVNVHPENFLTGFGLGMFIFYIPGLIHGSGMEPIDSGWITVMMDIGGIGAAVLVLFIFTISIGVLKSAAVNCDRERILAQAVVGALMGCGALHLGTGALMPIMIWAGICTAFFGMGSSSALAVGKVRPQNRFVGSAQPPNNMLSQNSASPHRLCPGGN